MLDWQRTVKDLQANQNYLFGSDAKSMFSINISNCDANQNNENGTKKSLMQLFSSIGKDRYKEVYELEILKCKREYSKWFVGFNSRAFPIKNRELMFDC